MTSINAAELFTHGIHGSAIMGLSTVTTPKLKGGMGNPLQGQVREVKSQRVMVFTNSEESGYENMVKRRMQEEGIDPESWNENEVRWGTRIPNSPLISHKDKFYVECIILEEEDVHYYHDNEELTPDQIPGLDPEKAAWQGGIQNKVKVRRYAIDSIKEIRFNNTKFTDIQFNWEAV